MTGLVRVVTAVVTGFLPCKLLMGNNVTDVTGKMGVRLNAKGLGLKAYGRRLSRGIGDSRRRNQEIDAQRAECRDDDEGKQTGLRDERRYAPPHA